VVGISLLVWAYTSLYKSWYAVNWRATHHAPPPRQRAGAGAVNVLYGDAGGPTGAGSQPFTQVHPGSAGLRLRPARPLRRRGATGDALRPALRDPITRDGPNYLPVVLWPVSSVGTPEHRGQLLAPRADREALRVAHRLEPAAAEVDVVLQPPEQAR
jgi:hypothetical protein